VNRPNLKASGRASLKGAAGPHLRYFAYVLRHKWLVTIAAHRLGITRQGLWHDLSKFRPSEFRPYVEHLYGRQRCCAHLPHGAVCPAFRAAVQLHYDRNHHHPEHWRWHVGYNRVRVYPMPEEFMLEMIADWSAMSRAKEGTWDWRPWYRQERKRWAQLMNADTLEAVDALADYDDLTEEDLGEALEDDTVSTWFGPWDFAQLHPELTRREPSRWRESVQRHRDRRWGRY
jgi:hypothetical protein